MAGSKCNSCGAQYPQLKTQCPNCGAAIAPAYPQAQAPAKSGMSPLLKAAIIIAGGFFGLIILLPLILSVGVAMFPSSTSEQTSTVKPIAQKLPVSFDGNVAISARVEGGSRPVVVGETSLPDGVAFMVDIKGKNNKYSAAHRPVVRGGKFTAGPFTYADGPLYAGEYTIAITMERPEIQLPEVVPFLGKQGERLRGPQVVKRQITGYPEFQTVVLDISAKIENSADDLKAHYGDWSYSADTDELSGQKYKTALLQSKNSFTLDFPYSGMQHGTLMLRNHPKHGRDVVVSIERGQILCHSYSDCSVDIAFDEKSARTVQGNEPANREDTLVFLPQPKRLMGEMAKAREMRVRLILFNQPSVTLVFPTAGLDLQQL